MKEENIFQAHYRIYNKLIFIISCFDIDYPEKYIKNINSKSFKNYFRIIKSDDPTYISDIYDKTDKKIYIFITKLPVPELFSFNFLTDVFHIHIALPNKKSDFSEVYTKYTSEIQNIPVQKFINAKNTEVYNDNIEDKIFDAIISIVDKKLNKTEKTVKSEKFKRMPQLGGKLIIYGDRLLNE